MAKELDWLPGTMGGMAGMSPQMGPAMQEFQKNLITIKGMPLLQNMSFGMSATGVPQNTATSSAPQPAPAQPASTDQTSVPTSTRDAIGKGIGGMFGGFGKKKKQAQQDQDAQASTTDASGSTVTQSGSLMEMQVEVTQYSNSSIDRDVFEIPAGYTQVQQDPNQWFGGTRKQ
jgi:hypothetical protein